MFIYTVPPTTTGNAARLTAPRTPPAASAAVTLAPIQPDDPKIAAVLTTAPPPSAKYVPVWRNAFFCHQDLLTASRRHGFSPGMIHSSRLSCSVAAVRVIDVSLGLAKATMYSSQSASRFHEPGPW